MKANIHISSCHSMHAYTSSYCIVENNSAIVWWGKIMANGKELVGR